MFTILKKLRKKKKLPPRYTKKNENSIKKKALLSIFYLNISGKKLFTNKNKTYIIVKLIYIINTFGI